MLVPCYRDEILPGRGENYLGGELLAVRRVF